MNSQLCDVSHARIFFSNRILERIGKAFWKRSSANIRPPRATFSGSRFRRKIQHQASESSGPVCGRRLSNDPLARLGLLELSNGVTSDRCEVPDFPQVQV